MRWSVIVCSYNRAQDLAAALERLGQLRYPTGDHEILVVDNASTDETPEVIAAASARMPNLVSVRAEKPGLSHARNQGIATARGELVAFIDDDAWPDSNWLQALEEGFAYQETACAGGKVAAAWPEEGPPEWLTERLFCFFSLVDYGRERILSYPNYPAGTNIAFRKSVFQEIGWFSEELGRTGASLLSMEEVDICLRVEDAGYQVRYLPDAVVFHKVSASRCSEAWFRERLHCQGVSAAFIEVRRFPIAKLLLKLAKYLIFILGGSIGRIIFTAIGNQQLAFFCTCQIILCKAYLNGVLFSSR